MSKKTSSTPATKPTIQDLASQVDRLGTVRSEKSKLELEEKELKQALSQVLIKEGDSLSGTKFTASVVIPDERSVKTDSLIKKIGQKKFNEIASVTLGALKNILGDEDIDAVVTMGKGSPRITTKKN
jgi:hypothetical protein